MRVIVRRERPHPGAQLSLLEEADGWRYQAFATNTRVGQLAFLEARHRAHARVEDRIKAAKDTGLGRFPSREYAINQAWLQIVAVAADLTAWLRLLALDGDLAAAEPKTLRFRMLHVPARLIRSGRRRQLRLPASLAMGRPDRRRVPPDHDHPRTHLTPSADRPPLPEEPSETRPGAPPGEPPRPNPSIANTPRPDQQLPRSERS